MSQEGDVGSKTNSWSIAGNLDQCYKFQLNQRHVFSTNRDIRNKFNISDRAALDEIMKLPNLEVIKRKGKGRSLRYELV